MNRTILVGAFALLSLLPSHAAQAAEHVGKFVIYDDVADVIGFEGPIDDSTAGDFRRALAARPGAKVLLLNSGGGDVDDALRLAGTIRQRGLGTAIPRGAACYSACSYLFFAGHEHIVRGELGVHQVAAAGSSERAYDGDVREALRRYGAPAGVIAAMISAPPTRLHVFSAREIAALAINRTGGSKSLTAVYAER